MAAQIIYLLPDTNLFIQCRPLEELDWSAWKEFDEVRLIVSRPVQREIDNQKNRGNDRVGSRARQTNSLFREIIIGEQGYKLIRDANPQVKLFIEPSFLPSPELVDRLDYSKPDDELVGCIHAYLSQNPDANAQLLTHDSGPMGSAKMLALPFVAMPDEWLMPPENKDEKRKINRLESDLARLRKAEPEFHIACLDGGGNEIDRLEFEHPIYEELTENEISELINSLKSSFRLATDFGSREPAEREPKTGTFRIAGVKEIYAPVLDEEITEYTETKYPAWIEKCEKVLRELENSLQREVGPPAFCFVASNGGTRPGKDALLTIEAKGDFQIRPPDIEDDVDQVEADTEKKIELPRPPNPPLGKWQIRFGSRYPNALSSTETIRALQRAISPLAQITSTGRYMSEINMPILARTDYRRDPNGFYWKPRRPMMPGKSFGLECEQWRHGIEDEYFSGDIFFNRGADEISGALECRIHAENLSATAIKIIPVRITITKISARERAEKLIADLIKREV